MRLECPPFWGGLSSLGGVTERDVGAVGLWPCSMPMGLSGRGREWGWAKRVVASEKGL